MLRYPQHASFAANPHTAGCARSIIMLVRSPVGGEYSAFCAFCGDMYNDGHGIDEDAIGEDMDLAFGLTYCSTDNNTMTVAMATTITSTTTATNVQEDTFKCSVDVETVMQVAAGFVVQECDQNYLIGRGGVGQSFTPISVGHLTKIHWYIRGHPQTSTQYQIEVRTGQRRTIVGRSFNVEVEPAGDYGKAMAIEFQFEPPIVLLRIEEILLVLKPTSELSGYFASCPDM